MSTATAYGAARRAVAALLAIQARDRRLKRTVASRTARVAWMHPALAQVPRRGYVLAALDAHDRATEPYAMDNAAWLALVHACDDDAKSILWEIRCLQRATPGCYLIPNACVWEAVVVPSQ